MSSCLLTFQFGLIKRLAFHGNNITVRAVPNPTLWEPDRHDLITMTIPHTSYTIRNKDCLGIFETNSGFKLNY